MTKTILSQALINQVLQSREKLGQKGMVFTYNKKGWLIAFRLRY